MKHPVTNDDIADAAENVLSVASAICDMVEGGREVAFTGSEFVDPLMHAHGVLSALLQTPSGEDS